MSIERPEPPHPEQSEHHSSALIPHFPRLRDIRDHYSRLETAKYGSSWGNLELLEGTRGDIGDLSKLETGRRGLRDGYSPEAAAHEVVDCAWSLVVSADSNLVDPAQACAEADRRGALNATPRQLINRLSLAVALVDEAVDPPPEPLFAHNLDDRETSLVGYYAEGFRAATALANAYGMDLSQAIGHNMDLLEQRIQFELAQGA
jgi:hypothetical protein